MDPHAAKSLYEQITSLGGFDLSLQIHPDVSGRDSLIDSVGEALQDCSVTDGGRLYHAPSPWHACFQLWERLAAARRRGSASFYRGHNVGGLPCVAAGLF
jgi:hypothetical protein